MDPKEMSKVERNAINRSKQTMLVPTGALHLPKGDGNIETQRRVNIHRMLRNGGKIVRRNPGVTYVQRLRLYTNKWWPVRIRSPRLRIQITIYISCGKSRGCVRDTIVGLDEKNCPSLKLQRPDRNHLHTIILDPRVCMTGI